jgi:ribonuclease Z
MPLTITSHSTALFSTWHFIAEMGLLFDAGDGLSAGLGLKAGKVRHVFVSHADRDHVCGLLQFMQLNGRPQGPQVYYPRDCGSFPALQAFSRSFDPHVKQADWRGIAAGESISIGRGLTVHPFRNSHIPAPEDQHKSFSFLVRESRKKLRADHAGLPAEQIMALRYSLGEAAVFEEIYTEPLGYSGDTPDADPAPWQNVHTLIHEATFLRSEDWDPANPKRNKHSTLHSVLGMVAQTQVQHLILSHFSARYGPEEIQETVARAVLRYGLKIQVDLILPGRKCRIIVP